MRLLHFLRTSACLAFLFPAALKAQDFSYVYIQGDKQTPIYVKVEGEMLPRYGKNYALIGRLAPGPLNIDILFQQSAHPALHFTVMVPENGRRAFLLHQKGEGFTLYDLQQNFDLQPNNDINDDHLPAQISNASLQATNNTANTEQPLVKNESPDVIPPVAKATLEQTQEAEKTVEPPVVAAEPIKTTPAQQKPATADEPVFIGGIELNNNREANNGESVATQNTAAGDNTQNNVAIVNSDCTSAMADTKFVQLFASMKAKKSEDERLGLFLQACKQYCFTTDMIAQLAQTMDTDPARFSVVKNAYSKTTDQEKFPGLESLFASGDWKEEFKDLLHH